MYSAVEPQATFKSRVFNNVQEQLLLPIQGVARGSETMENKACSPFLARPEQVRFGTRTGRFFRRPLQRTVRFESILQREHQTRDYLFQEKQTGGQGNTKRDV